MLDRTVAEPVLDEPCVMTRIGQGITAGVAQHVSMDPERQLGALANGLHEAVDGVRRERTPALSLEDERTRRIPLQLSIVRPDDACLIAEFVGVPVTHDHLNLWHAS